MISFRGVEGIKNLCLPKRCDICGKKMTEINKILQIFLNDRVTFKCLFCGYKKDYWLPETPS